MSDKYKTMNKMQSLNTPMIYPIQNTCGPGFWEHLNAKDTGKAFLKPLNDYVAHSDGLKSLNFLAMC